MPVLYYITISIIIADSLIGLILRFANKLEKFLFPIVLAATCSMIDEAIAHYFKVKFKNNLVVYYIFGPIEYCFFAWFLFLNIESVFVKAAIKISGGILLFCMLSYMYFYFHSDIYNKIIAHNYLTIAGSLFLTIWCICYFKNIFNRISRHEYLNVYVLIIVSGILFYNAFSTIFFSSENYLIAQAIKENPNFFTDILKVKYAAFTYAYQQLRDVDMFLFLTNILLYLCIFVVLLKSSITRKKYTIGF